MWWFGSLANGSIAVGFANCVGISLALLLYFSSLSKFSLNLIIVVFCSVMLLLTNLMLLYGSHRRKSNLLLPWMVTNSLATIALISFTAIKWSGLKEYKAVIVGTIIYSVYFSAVVTSYYHELILSKKLTENEKNIGEEGVGTPRADGLLNKEETVLVALEQEETIPMKPPNPDEVINVEQLVPTSPLNPFLSDIFDVKVKQQSSESRASRVELQPDFTPFKRPQTTTPLKMKVFLPAQGEDSDFDFSFNDPDFDSSLCATKHPDIE